MNGTVFGPVSGEKWFNLSRVIDTSTYSEGRLIPESPVQNWTSPLSETSTTSPSNFEREEVLGFLMMPVAGFIIYMVYQESINNCLERVIAFFEKSCGSPDAVELDTTGSYNLDIVTVDITEIG